MSAHVEHRYGFQWGQVNVERMADWPDGYKTLSIRPSGGTHKQGIQIHVSPKGRSIRVFRNGEELR